MNGVDAVAIATGNDWRAIEAGAHAYAAASGKYGSLTRWSAADNGDLLGEITLPLKVATVGGTLKSNPGAALGLAMTGANYPLIELAELMAAVGLAPNFAALRALATSGIQAGHMKLHARSVVTSAGTPDALNSTRLSPNLIASGEIKDWKAQEELAGNAIASGRGGELASAASGKAAGKMLFCSASMVWCMDGTRSHYRFRMSSM